MTTEEAQIILLESLISTANKGMEFTLSEPDILHLTILINNLKSNIEQQNKAIQRLKEHLGKIDPKHFEEKIYEDVKLENLDNKEVIPKYISGMNVSWNLNIFTGPKLYIECGKCGFGFKYRMPLKSNPRVFCSCGAINKIPLEYG